jgi:FtsH-binding integral membrane protein
MSQYNVLDLSQTEVDERTFISQVYLWMATALVITAILAAAVAADTRLVVELATSSLFWILLIGELALVFVLSLFINRMPAAIATIAFFGYAALNGITLSIIFLIYTDASITSTFLVTAGTFGLMSAYGYFTKRDLTSWGNLLFMGLIGVVIASVVNLFLNNSTVYWIVTYVGILVFVGLTAYDTQKLKRMASGSLMTGEQERKASIIGALALYLDFINLFLLLLRVMGGGRRS